MADYAYALQQAEFDRSIGVRRRAWPKGEYVRAYDEPPGASQHGETITEYQPTPEDINATDWVRA